MYHIQLITSGFNNASVIEKIIEFTDQSSEKAKSIVQELGIIQCNVNPIKAKQFQGELMSLGSQIILLSAEEFTLSQGKPLHEHIQNKNEQSVVGTSLKLKMTNVDFDRQ